MSRTRIDLHTLLGAAAVAALVVSTPANAEEKLGSVSSPLVVSSAVEIVNGGAQAVNFAIRPADGIWKTYSVAPGGNREISCTGCSTPYFQFSMTTGAVTVKYRLRPTKRYIVRWNAGKNCWDLYNFNN